MRWLAACLVAALCPAGARASSTRTWELSSYGDFLAGTFDNAALDQEGSIRVAPAVAELYASDQAVVWSIARAADGTVYIGTGHQGAVFRIPPDAEGALLWKAPEIEVLALAVGQDGMLYAGTAPNGKVYRVTAAGAAEEFFDPGEKYIWCLLFDAQGRLIVGTGNGGKVYRVEAEGNGEVWLASGQRHVMSLAQDGDGRVLAGTDPEGILYRVDDSGRSFALYDADLPEIRSVAVAADGAVYFGAMGGGMDRILQAIPVQQAGGQAQAAVVVAQPGAQVAAPQVSSAVTYAQPQVAYAGERSNLMRLRVGRAVEELWTSNEEHVLGLAVEDGAEPRVLFATNREGRLYRLGGDRRLSLVSQTSRPQITTLLRTPEGVLLGSAHGGGLYRLAAAPANEGTYESAPHNTDGISRWGRLAWRAETSAGGQVAIRTRSGNTYRPDASWSAWSEPLTEEDGSPVASPAARFLQWRAKLVGAARLDSVRVHYLPQNSAPVVQSVNVVPEEAQAAATSGAATAGQTNSYSITVSASGASSPPRPAGRGRQATTSPVRKLAIVWGAEDPDGDKLRAEVAFRGVGETAWKTIGKDLPGPRHSIESDTLADGRYEFRVRVDDGLANSADRALSAERVSRIVLVDQTPPRVRALEAAPDGGLRFEAEDGASELRSAEYAVDAGAWHPVLPEDGILDARRERFAVRPGALEPGEHLVVLRVRDQAGNAALAKALVR